MVGMRLLAAAVLAAFALCGGAQAAEEWALAGDGPKGDTFELDLASLARTGDVVQAQVRENFAEPARDPASRRLVAVTRTQVLYDCKNNRWATGAIARFDPRGRPIDEANAGLLWQPLRPGSVAEVISHSACGSTADYADEPLVKDVAAAQWLDLGLSQDGQTHFFVRMDKVVKLDGDVALFLDRADYANPMRAEGLVITRVVEATAVDCKGRLKADLGRDIYIGAYRRAASTRIAKKDLAFAPIRPGSFLAQSLESICAAAVAPKRDQADDQGLSTGTAWGVAKGYLVTASHVITGGGEIGVYSKGELIGTATVVADDPVNDVAILKFEPEKGRPRRILALPLSGRPALLGRPVFTLGYPAPDTMGAQVKMTAGQVSGLSGVRDDTRFLQISVPVQPGNSGGPLIGWDGQVLGVVDSKLEKIEGETLPPENVNYALKTAYIRPLLEGLPDLGNYALLKPGLPHDALIAQAQQAVFMLLVAPAAE